MFNRGDFETEREFMAYCAARRDWSRRNEKTPSGRFTWGQRFRQLYGRSLEEARLEYLAKLDP